MALETKNLVIAFALVGLFAFALISFSVNYEKEWTGSSTILNDSRISKIYTDTNSSLRQGKSTYGSYNETLYTEDIKKEGTLSSIIFSGIIKITQAFTGFFTSIFNSIFVPLLSLLGLSREVAGIVSVVFSTLLGMISIFLAYKLIRQGS